MNNENIDVSSNSVGSTKPTHPNASIFIIDDEQLITEVIRMYLRKGGYKNLHVFTDPVEAMETLSFVRTDLILTDVDMPELSGKFLTRLARKTPHLESTPIIVITSDDSEATRKKLVGNGADAILNKPVDCNDLLETVARTLRSSQTDQSSDKKAESSKRAVAKEQELRQAFNR